LIKSPFEFIDSGLSVRHCERGTSEAISESIIAQEIASSFRTKSCAKLLAMTKCWEKLFFKLTNYLFLVKLGVFVPWW
jgi:hypothetical protein